MTNRGQEPAGRSGEKAQARKSKGESPKQGRRARKGETVMKLVQGNGINYEVRGQCEEEAFSVTLSDLAENDDIRLIRVAILISKANSYLMLNEQMIGVIVRNIDESIIAVHQ